jgi:hypothetical protein
MLNLKRLLAGFTFALITCGCVNTTTYTNRKTDEQAAEKVTNQFFDYLKNREYFSVYPLFGKKFYAAASTGKLFRTISNAQHQMGDVMSTTIKDTSGDRYNTPWRIQVDLYCSPFKTRHQGNFQPQAG